MPGRAYTELFERATDQHGFITQAEAVKAGFSTTTLRNMVRRGVLERVAWGLYRFPAYPHTALDSYREATLWPQPARGILSHDTALELHDLCDVNPSKVHITVPQRYRTNREVPRTYALYRRDLTPRDVTFHDGIAVVTPLRAILDGLERGIGLDLIGQAMGVARRRGLIPRETLVDLEQSLGSTIELLAYGRSF